MKRTSGRIAHYIKNNLVKRAWIFAVILLQVSVLFFVYQVKRSKDEISPSTGQQYSFEELWEERRSEGSLNNLMGKIEVTPPKNNSKGKAEYITNKVKKSFQNGRTLSFKQKKEQENSLHEANQTQSNQEAPSIKDIDISHNELDLVSGEIKVKVALEIEDDDILLEVLQGLSKAILLNNQEKGITSVQLTVEQKELVYQFNSNKKEVLKKINIIKS